MLCFSDIAYHLACAFQIKHFTIFRPMSLSECTQQAPWAWVQHHQTGHKMGVTYFIAVHPRVQCSQGRGQDLVRWEAAHLSDHGGMETWSSQVGKQQAHEAPNNTIAAAPGKKVHLHHCIPLDLP